MTTFELDKIIEENQLEIERLEYLIRNNQKILEKQQKIRDKLAELREMFEGL